MANNRRIGVTIGKRAGSRKKKAEADVAEPSELDHSPWWFRATVIAGAGFLFSALSSVLIVSLLSMGFPPAAALERAGADLSMRLYSNFHDFSQDAPEDLSFVLLDLDKGACAKLLGALNPECALGRPAPIELVWKATAAASQAGAHVILVDVDMESDPKGRQAFFNGLSTLQNAWIVVPFKSRASDEVGRINVDVAEAPRSGRVRAAAFATIISGSDGLLRQYPRFLGLGDSKHASVPTAPWVAIQLAGLSDQKKKELAGQTEGDIFYSLPRVNEAESAVSDSYRHILEYIPVSSMQISGTEIGLPDGRLDGKIVVIGSSSGAGQNLHSTPVGTRSGSEILVNAMRTLTAFKPITALSRETSSTVLIGVGIEKISSAILPTLIILGFLLVRERLYELKKSAGWRAAVWMGSTALVVVFLIVFELAVGLSSVGTAAREGRCIDLVTPLVTLGLDFYRETAGAIVKFLEGLVNSIMWRLARVWQRLSATNRQNDDDAERASTKVLTKAKSPGRQRKAKLSSVSAGKVKNTPIPPSASR